jgi:hypothetical protein
MMTVGLRTLSRSRTVGAVALLASACVLAMAVLAVAIPGSAAAKGSRERNVEGTITLTLTPPSESLPLTSKINLFVPERFHDAGAKLPHCSAAALEAKGIGGCSSRSIVGAGTSLGYTILGGEFVEEHLALTLFNGPGGSLLTWVVGKTPVSIEVVVQGVISKPAGYGQEFSFTIPHGLLEPLPGAPGWLQTLNARLNGKVGWLRSSSCPAHPWSLKAEIEYTNGQALTLQTHLACV